MPYRPISFIYLLTLLLLIFLFFTPYQAGDILFFCIICVTALENIVIKNAYKALLFSTLNIIIVAFMFIMFLFLNPQHLYLQGMILFDYIIFSIICFSLWFITYHEFTLRHQLIVLSQQVDYLRKLQKNDGVLSDESFNKQELYILTGAKRRKESCQYLHIYVNISPKDIVFSSLMATLEQQLIYTFRYHYDIIKKDSPTSYLCLLQNVDASSLSVIEKRLLHNLSQHIVSPEKLITFDASEVSLDD